MSQMTWRAPDGLMRQVRDLAAEQGVSMNEWMTRLAATAVADDEADPPGVRLRARLRAAGLLAAGDGGRAPAPPPAERLAASRRAAGQGTPLSEFIADGRR